MQGAGFGAFNTNLPFTGVNQNQAQNRNVMGNSISGQERIASPGVTNSSGRASPTHTHRVSTDLVL